MSYKYLFAINFLSVQAMAIDISRILHPTHKGKSPPCCCFCLSATHYPGHVVFPMGVPLICHKYAKLYFKGM